MKKSILLKKIKLWSVSALECASLFVGYNSFSSSALKKRSTGEHWNIISGVFREKIRGKIRKWKEIRERIYNKKR